MSARRLGALCAAISLLSAVAGAATPSPAPSNLPGYDVDWETPLNQAIRIGDELALKIGPVTGTGPFTVNSPDTLGESGWSLEPAPAPAPSPGTAPADAQVVHLHVSPLKKGHLTLPELMILDSTGAAVGATRPFALEVQSSIDPNDPKAAEPAPMRPPLGLQFPLWATITLSLAALVLLAGLSYGGYRLYRRYRGRPAAALARPVEPPRPEDELALALLDQLERDDLLTQGKFKPHYFRLSDILKNYLGRRFDFDAPESTTREIVRHLETHPGILGDALRVRLEGAFQRLDRVKFTDHVPGGAEGAELLALAREFVRMTRRPPPSPAPVAGSMPVPPAGGARAPR